MKAPTMVYAPNGVNGGTEGEGYWYKVIDADEVEDALLNGWYAAPADINETKELDACKVVNEETEVVKVKRKRRTKEEMEAARE